jgi:hypothetical protein
LLANDRSINRPALCLSRDHRYYDLEGLWTLQKRIGDRSEQDEVVEVEDLDPLPDLDDVPNAWNPWDQTVHRA